MPRGTGFGGGVAQGLQFGMTLNQQRRQAEQSAAIQNRTLAQQQAQEAQSAIDKSLLLIQQGLQDFVKNDIPLDSPLVKQFVTGQARAAVRTSQMAHQAGFGAFVMSPQQVLTTALSFQDRTVTPEREQELAQGEARAEQAGEEAAKTAAGEENLVTIFFPNRPGPDRFQSFDTRNPAQRERMRRILDAAQTGEGEPAFRFDPSTSTLGPSDLALSVPIREFDSVMASTGDSLAGLERMEQLLLGVQGNDAAKAYTGIAGGLATLSSQLVGAAAQLQDFFGGENVDAAGNPVDRETLLAQEYDLGSLAAAGGETRAFRSQIINLAYALARSADPGGRLSERDVQAQIDRLGARGQSKQDIIRTLEEVRFQIKTTLAQQHAVLARRHGINEVGPLPLNMWPTTPEDERILNEWNGRFDEMPETVWDQLSTLGAMKAEALQPGVSAER